RLALAFILILLGWSLYQAIVRFGLTYRARRSLKLDNYKPGRTAILYFTSSDCLPCKTVQRPALEKLATSYGDRLQIIEIDATREPRLADAWGVLSLPTTFIIDSQGRPRGVNHGVTRAQLLVRQLEEIGEPAPRSVMRAESRPGFTD
ncbi:MAG: conjugal transfer protein TraF, partial [Anaerolineae bacterium]|nr:conjugal transfer protein TraF [Anaerolineae bacterium]NIN95486.1 conjugal transfer protein TraF [Anaerolineae bacterium]